MKNLVIIAICFGLGFYSVQAQINPQVTQGTVSNDQAFVNRTPYDASYNNPRIDPSNMTNEQYDAIYNNPKAPRKKDDDDYNDCDDLSPVVKEDQLRIEHKRSHSVPN